MKASIHRIVSASLVLLTGTLAAQTRCAVESFGPADQDPITISGDFVLPAECTLDFGDRAVVLEGSLRALDLTLLAGELTILEKGLIEGGPGTTTIILSAGRAHGGDFTTGGSLINDGVHGGAIDLQAAGTVTAKTGGGFDASARDPAGYGGFISIFAEGDVTLLDDGTPLQALGGDNAEFNGEVSIFSHGGAVNLNRGITVSGGTLIPGAVTINAATGLVVGGPIRATGHCAGGVCGRGGIVILLSSGDLNLLSSLDVSGADGSVVPGDGNGGSVKIDAAGDVTVGADVLLGGGAGSSGGSFAAYSGGTFKQAGAIDASGRAPDSSGGSIVISAGIDARLTGKASANGGVDGEGGSIELVADQVLDVEGPASADGNYPTTGIELVSVNDAIQVTGLLSADGLGDFGTGGPVSLFAVTDIQLPGSIRASGQGPDGLGGAVKLDSFLAVHVGGQAAIVTNGDPVDPKIGEGGTIDIRACLLAIDPGAGFQATGATGGGIFITTSDGAALPAAFQASDGGLIQIKFPTDLPPDLSGGTFIPDPVLVPTDSIDPCALPTPCDPVTALACKTDGSTAVLSWTNSPTNTGVQVLRDGNVVATLGPTDETFTEGGLPAGPHTYLVQGSCRGRPSSGASCDVTVSTGVTFKRGDCNASGDSDISDAVTVLGYLYLGEPKGVKCEKACDSNDDGSLDVSDAVFLLAYLFTDPTKIPPPPLGRCGLDEKPDNLTCESFGACQR